MIMIQENKLQEMVELAIYEHIKYLINSEKIETDKEACLEDTILEYCPTDRDVEEYIRVAFKEMSIKDYKKFRENGGD